MGEKDNIQHLFEDKEVFGDSKDCFSAADLIASSSIASGARRFRAGSKILNTKKKILKKNCNLTNFAGASCRYLLEMVDHRKDLARLAESSTYCRSPCGYF